MPERVLVVPRRDLLPDADAGHGASRSSGGELCGFRALRDGEAREDLAARLRGARYVLRDAAEDDPSLKQLIPYAVVVRRPPAATPEGPISRDGLAGLDGDVFLMRRTRGGSESRLWDLHSIGVGGHVNPVDGDPVSPGSNVETIVEAALRREIDEELVGAGGAQLRLVGCLNDDSNAVGRVHFGLVYLCEVGVLEANGQDVAVRETDQLEGEFVPVTSLAQRRETMESWSAHLVDGLCAEREAPSASQRVAPPES